MTTLSRSTATSRPAWCSAAYAAAPWTLTGRTAGYRCRHGRNNAHSLNPGRPHILYCREDQLIEALQRNPVLTRAHPRLRQGSAPVGVGDELLRHSMILIGDHDGWMVETVDASVTLTAAHLPAALQHG